MIQSLGSILVSKDEDATTVHRLAILVCKGIILHGLWSIPMIVCSNCVAVNQSDKET
jgi:hypothetical protein